VNLDDPLQKPTLALFGATSYEGQALARAFLAQGWTVRALTRNQPRAQGVLPLRLDWYEGNLNQPSSIEAVLAGASAVYFALGGCPFSREMDFQPLREGIGTAVMIAKRLGIQRGGVRLPPWVNSEKYRREFWLVKLHREAVATVELAFDEAQVFAPSYWFEDWKNGLFARKNQVYFDPDACAVLRPLAIGEWAEDVATVFSMKKSLPSRRWAMQGPLEVPVKTIVDHWLSNSDQNLSIQNVSRIDRRVAALWNPELRWIQGVYACLKSAEVEPFRAHQTWMELRKPQMTLENLISKS
jgi:hypothetical protein